MFGLSDFNIGGGALSATAHTDALASNLSSPLGAPIKALTLRGVTP